MMMMANTLQWSTTIGVSRSLVWIDCLLAFFGWSIMWQCYMPLKNKHFVLLCRFAIVIVFFTFSFSSFWEYYWFLGGSSIKSNYPEMRNVSSYGFCIICLFFVLDWGVLTLSSERDNRFWFKCKFLGSFVLYFFCCCFGCSQGHLVLCVLWLFPLLLLFSAFCSDKFSRVVELSWVE